MARIRTIKPEFFRHEGLFEAERESKLPLRVAFVGLWTASDREGRFNWRPRQLKLDCLPYDDVDFSRVLDALLTRGFIVKYAENSELYGFIPSWPAHQFVNNREAASTLPPPSDSSIESATLTREARVDDVAARADGNCVKGKERKGKERKGKEGERNKDASPTAPSDVDPQVWADWKANRKTKKAAVTSTVLNAIREEAAKAGISFERALQVSCKKNWVGFEAAWYSEKKINGSHSKQSELEQRNQEASNTWLRGKKDEPEIFDAIATERQG